MDAFELHCHSMYSKGRKIPWEGIPSPKEIIRYAKKIGLSGIAITDHNTTKGIKEGKEEAKKSGILFIPGIEISSAKGHIIGLGIEEEIKTGLSVEETVEKIHEQGGLAIAAHPFDTEKNGIRNEMVKTDAVEIFNAFNIDRIGNFIAARKAKHLNLKGVVGSDAHTLEMIGTSILKAEANDIEELFKCIKNGNIKTVNRYIEIRKVINWVKERVERSKEDVLKYISTHYSKPKAIISEFLVQEFLKKPESRAWYYLAIFGLNIYFLKSIINPNTYY